MASYTGFDYSTGLKYLNEGIDEIGKAAQRKSIADIGGQIDGTPEGYRRVGQALAAKGDMTAASQFLTLAEQAQAKAARNAVFAPTPVAGAGTGGRSVADIGASDYYGKTAKAESGGDPNAKNPNSTATGVFQFLSGTWADLAKRRPELGLTPDGRTDPEQQNRAMRAFTEENAGALRKAGVEPTDGNLYMAHFLGAGDAPNFIKGAQQDPSVPAADLVNPRSVAANRTVFYRPDGTPKTAGEVYAGMTRRFGAGSTALAAGQPQQPVQLAQAPAQGGAPAADVPAQGARTAQGFTPPGMPQMPANLRPDISDERLVAIGDDPRAKYLLEERRRWRDQNDPDKRELTRLDIETKRKALAKGDTPETIREFEIAKERGYTQAKTPGEYAREKLAPRGPQKVGENETLVDENGNVIFKGGSGGPKLEAITSLRKEVQNLPSYKNVAQAAPIYKTMLDAASRDTKAADLNLIYGLGKIMDPTSVVREGELVLANDTQGVGERLNGMINSINGGARLGPEARKALMQEAYSRISSYRSQFDNDAEQFTGIAARNGMDLRDILPNMGEFKPFEPAKKKGDGGTGEAKADGTKTMAPVKLPTNATPDDVMKRLRPGMTFIDPNGVLRRVPERAAP